MEDVGIFYGHFVHFTVLCYILCTFGIVCGNLVYFFRFGILYQEKSGNPDRFTARGHLGQDHFAPFSETNVSTLKTISPKILTKSIFYSCSSKKCS
jgi:hypothetical protein